MTDTRKTDPTLMGLPDWKPRAVVLPPPEPSVAPVKLTPYRDVRIDTPSHQRPLRERGESTPVYIPPARRLTPEQMAKRRELDKTRTMRRPEPRIDPWDIALAAAIVCLCLFAGALLL